VQSQNKLLNSLDGITFSKVAPALATVLMEAGTLAFPYERIDRVYFPHGGIISTVIDLANGGSIVTGMVGKDGQWGGSQAMDGKLSLVAATVTVPMTASAIDADRLQRLADQLPDFRALLMQYDQYLFAQVQQTAACNAVHSAEMRACSLLVRMHDLVGPDLRATQADLAQRIGVTRPRITEIANGLQQAGVISYSRGLIHIHDPDKLESRACGCAKELRTFHKLLFD
jgi:CRP-like cAMP-binding protein